MPSIDDGRVRTLTLPGWLNSGPEHWQSRWEQQRGFQRVEQADWLWPRRGDWMARLDEVLLESPQRTILVAHSLGCQLVAAWAAHSGRTQQVRAALLVAPPDTERDDVPPNLAGWRPIVRATLPFPSLVLASSNDPFCSLARAARMAADWGSGWRELGALGHINGESGLGDWPEGVVLLEALTRGSH